MGLRFNDGLERTSAPPIQPQVLTDLPDYPAITELKRRPQWVAWRYEDRGGPKPTKPPINPHTGGYAKSDDPSTWGTYDQAIERARRDDLAGVGFMLADDDNYSGYDFDKCRNPQTGRIKPWARELLSHGETYAEISPSDTGIRLIARGKISKAIKCNAAKVEVYGRGRYLTITGNKLADIRDSAGNKLADVPDSINPAVKTRVACQERAELHSRTWAALAEAAKPREASAKTQASGTTTRKRGVLWRAMFGDGDPFFRGVNDKALEKLSSWVPALLPKAQESNLGFRVSSADLGRDYEEDLSITPQGIVDFGVHDMGDANLGKRTPIDVVLKYGTAGTAVDAALWLCEQMGIEPATLGWRGKQQGADRDGQHNDLIIVSAEDLEMCGVTWLWPDRFARGKIGLIAGLPDKGKGQICAFLAAAVTNKVPLPCGEGFAPQGNVIWFNAEDGAGDTILPRLAAAGADMKRVHIVTGRGKHFNLVTDLPLLRKAIERIGNVVLVIIDPMSAYLGVGKVDSRAATDVRGVLTPLKDMAEELDVAVIGIAHFNKKDDVRSALLRVSDSIAYVAAARHVYAVLDDPEDDNFRLFVKAKNNLAADKTALRYGMSVKTVGFDAKRGVDIKAPYVIWHPEHVKITANEAMQSAGGRTAKREAREFLIERLEAGPVKAADLLEGAKQEGIAARTLHRAKKDMGVKSWKERGTGGEWLWELPSQRGPARDED